MMTEFRKVPNCLKNKENITHLGEALCEAGVISFLR